MQSPAAGNAPPTEEQLLQAEIERFNSIQGDILLSRVTHDVADIESKVNSLPTNIATIR